jgi:hypothetical protein
MVCWWVLVHFDRSLQLYVWGVKLEAKPAVIRLFFIGKIWSKREIQNSKIIRFWIFCQLPDVREKK